MYTIREVDANDKVCRRTKKTHGKHARVFGGEALKMALTLVDLLYTGEFLPIVILRNDFRSHEIRIPMSQTVIHGVSAIYRDSL